MQRSRFPFANHEQGQILPPPTSPPIRAGAPRSRKRTFEPEQTGSLGLGGVDKFEPVSGGGDLDHAEKAFGELILSRGDGANDFQATEDAFDVIAFPGKRPLC
jgi:hypothetical protein